MCYGKVNNFPQSKIVLWFLCILPLPSGVYDDTNSNRVQIIFPFSCAHYTDSADHASAILVVSFLLFFFLFFFLCFFCLFVSFFEATTVQVERKQWLECRWTKQFVLSIDDWSMGGQTSLFYLFTNYLRTCCGLVTIGQLWNRKSHPVDQLVCVCGCDYVQEQGIRSRCTI